MKDLAGIPERIALPRPIDAIRAMVGIAKECDEREVPDRAVVDFEGAFKHLPARASEKRFLSGKAVLNGEPGFFACRAVLFGAIGGPPVWGRVAALLLGVAAASVEPGRAGLQCDAGDPLVVLRGSPDRRNRMLLMVLLNWTVTGFKLSWAKGARGQAVDWIGARLSFVLAGGIVARVAAAINEDKAIALAPMANESLGKNSVNRGS